MLLRWIGLCLTLLGAAGTGAGICREREGRVRQLELLGGLFSRIAGEIAYGRTGMPEILTQIGGSMTRSGETALGTVLEEIGKGLLAGEGMETLWRKQFGAYLGQTGLREEERRLLLSFPALVSFPDTGRQKKAVQDFAGDLARRAAAAGKRAGEEKRVTMAVSLAGGALTALLLL